MFKKSVTLALVLSVLWVWTAPRPALAQDEGEPALKTLAVFSLGGAAAGAALGVMVWLLDPIGPSSDFTNSTFTGMALGTFAGAIFGGLQLQRQAVFPYEQAPRPNEFDGAMPLGINEHRSPALPTLRAEKAPKLPLVGFHLQF
ncbi:MAG: hypothetical protein A2600_00080 [Candidatus Lambdaproteobacteria bacterium RIFOXYD1_FULL_56_27]|uniref:Glycine zipper domain-containing protein n=1 Tax=Candidatus Lambdaproteobacteria bacterium RIFOXYD2_FULL_56_26 TaxID=1817773 RepID=A0A1F6GPJ0_9PROT|nr:MAG: hypothetical protein A2557_04200 [Candidatus Lambdaproteobacteria bacterium RIFOXYD2_FULL_56_26]OGH03916.1 MAG: hypothetical protein A2426_07425 [Candidatus Lambdaproteobacteria bacterium RIFOXYC1_FULL_56_13]OGH06173.1 MAG: hypothetical protein A2600_00080 [Candidatus Lambdaproteobacteria bacterium RIFOXYD1_FULL_56_27]